MRGTEDQFLAIVDQLGKNIKQYEEKKIKHYQFADASDNIFASYAWSKVEFYKELNSRLGYETNDSREEKKKQKQQLLLKTKKKK